MSSWVIEIMACPSTSADTYRAYRLFFPLHIFIIQSTYFVRCLTCSRGRSRGTGGLRVGEEMDQKGQFIHEAICLRANLRQRTRELGVHRGPGQAPGDLDKISVCGK